MYNPLNTLNGLISFAIQNKATAKIERHKRSGTLNDGKPFENLTIIERCKQRPKAKNLFDTEEPKTKFKPYRTQPKPLTQDKLYNTEYLDYTKPTGEQTVIVIEQRRKNLLQAFFVDCPKNKVIGYTVDQCVHELLMI